MAKHQTAARKHQTKGKMDCLSSSLNVEMEPPLNASDIILLIKNEQYSDAVSALAVLNQYNDYQRVNFQMDTNAWRTSFIETLYNLEAPVMSAIDLRKPMDDRLMAQADIAGKRAQFFSCLHACFEILEHPQGKLISWYEICVSNPDTTPSDWYDLAVECEKHMLLVAASLAISEAIAAFKRSETVTQPAGDEKARCWQKRGELFEKRQLKAFATAAKLVAQEYLDGRLGD